MFYWSYKNVHVVLSDEEEGALVRELCQDPIEHIMYFTSRKVRKDLERRITHYLRQNLLGDSEAFRHRYVFRSCYGKDAQKMLPVLLDAYGRITRRATIGIYGNRPKSEETTEKIQFVTSENLTRITLFERGRWLLGRPKISGYIIFPTASIEKLAGTVDNFFIICSTMSIKFHRDFVRVSVNDMSRDQENFVDS